MRALVTGGSGFIGSHVVDKLRDRNIRVRVYDMVYPDFRDDIEYYHASLLDFDSLRMALSKVDVIFHLGAIADVQDVLEEPHYAEAINVRGTINVLEAARKSGSIKRVIFGSTTWVYSDTQGDTLDEDAPLGAPSHLYTATKIAGEYYCQCYSRLYDLPVTILRYGIPYGPRAREGAVIPIFVKKALNGEPLTIAGDGLQYRKFVYVEDLAEGNVLALKEIARNKIYNLEGKEKVSIKQIAETIQKILGKVEIKHIEGRPGDFSGKEILANRAKEELGWEPNVSFEEGVRRYIEWYKKEKENRDSNWAQLDEVLRLQM
jgi:UDP-glucose 4-epimerase